MRLWRRCGSPSIRIFSLAPCYVAKATIERSFARVSKNVYFQTLLSEYEDVLGRSQLFRRSILSARERQQLFEAFLSVCEWVQVYYGWRPNLRDESANHLVELAIARGACAIVTHNLADFRDSELRFPQLRVVTPEEFMKEMM